MIQIVSRDTSPPLYYLSEHYWFKFFGTSEIAIRSLSFVFHLGTALTLFFLAKFLWDKKTALLALVMGFLNPFLFNYAFEGRMYAILAFTTTFSFYSYFRAFFDKKPSHKWKLIYVFSAALALYSHHFALFALFVQGLWILPLMIKRFRHPIRLNLLFKHLFSLVWPFFLTFVLYLAWLPALYYQTSLVASGFWLATPSLGNLVELFRKFLVGSQEYSLRIFALILVGLILALRKWSFRKKTDWILASWFVLPLVLTWSLSQVMQSIFFDRYLLFSIPAIGLLLASQKRALVSILLISLLAGVFFSVDWNYFTHPNKRPFRELAANIHQELQPTDVLINWNSAAHHIWETKYYGLEAPIYSPGGPLPFYVGTAQMTENDVIFEAPQAQRIGVITSGPIDEVRIEGYDQVIIREFGSLKIIWLEKNHR